MLCCSGSPSGSEALFRWQRRLGSLPVSSKCSASRWVYVVPSLARSYADPTLGPEQREMHASVFRALHQYLGVGVGEHLGYLFTGIWSVLIGIGIVLGTALPTWLGWPGIVIGAGLIVGSAEFLGPNEEKGWRLVGAAIPVLYIAWSLWLLTLGVALIV